MTKNICFPDVCGLSLINCYLHDMPLPFDCRFVYVSGHMICVNAENMKLNGTNKCLVEGINRLEAITATLHAKISSSNPLKLFSQTYLYSHKSFFFSFLYRASCCLKALPTCKYLLSYKHLHKAEKIHQSDDEIYFMAL